MSERPQKSVCKSSNVLKDEKPRTIHYEAEEIRDVVRNEGEEIEQMTYTPRDVYFKPFRKEEEENVQQVEVEVIPGEHVCWKIEREGVEDKSRLVPWDKVVKIDY